jgi:prevent-host-death family protein
MKQFSTVELLRDLKTVTMAADRTPVTITQHRKPRYVLMTYDDYQQITRHNDDRRRVFGPGETPPELAAMILPELDKLIEQGNKGDE